MIPAGVILRARFAVVSAMKKLPPTSAAIPPSRSKCTLVAGAPSAAAPPKAPPPLAFREQSDQFRDCAEDRLGAQIDFVPMCYACRAKEWTGAESAAPEELPDENTAMCPGRRTYACASMGSNRDYNIANYRPGSSGHLLPVREKYHWQYEHARGLVRG